jgi:hypothetical protein
MKTLQHFAYSWRQIPVGGGGYVTGIAIHPRERDLVYIRTDVGGLFRWNEYERCWHPLMQAFTREESSLFGIESLALDPRNADIIYVAAGKYRRTDDNARPPADILKSTDRGMTWARCGLDIDIGGNEPLRWAGERLALHPDDSQQIFYGSRWDGLWRSADAGEPGSWHRDETFPASGQITFVLHDGIRLLAGVWDDGVYLRSGASWQRLEGSPMRSHRAVLAGNLVYVSHMEGISRFDGARWHDVSPAHESFCALAVDPHDPNLLMTATLRHNFLNPIYRSQDGGASWHEIAYRRHSSVPWWPEEYWSAATASLAVDPYNARRVWYTDWYGAWRTDDITAEPSDWYTAEQGHEETCIFTLVSPPKDVSLITGLADNDGFRHESLAEFPRECFRTPYLQDATSIDFAEKQPHFFVRVGGRGENDHGERGGYSTDYGRTWTAFKQVPPDITSGRIAVSASARTIIWLPKRSIPYVSLTRGQVWQPCSGIPDDVIPRFWDWRQPLASDRVRAEVFYLYHAGALYRTENGLYWRSVATLPHSDWSVVKTAPGLAGHVWVALDGQSLWRSTESGARFQRLDGIERAYLLALGIPMPGSLLPTVFLMGTVNGQAGVFRSTDDGVTWQRIDMPEIALGNDPVVMTADRQVFGRVYVGMNGSGIYYGEAIAPEG